jgi:hypothetical protein
MNKLKRVVLRELYNFLQEHYFWTTLLLGMFPIWYSILKIAEKAPFLKDLFYVHNNQSSVDELRSQWSFVSFMIIILNVILIFLKAIADRKNMISNKDSQTIYREIFKSLHSSTVKKVQRFKDFINIKEDLTKYSAFKSITKPLLQIESLTDNLVQTLVKLFGLEQDDISISLYYRTNKDNTINQIHCYNTINDLSIKEVVKNEKSTFNYLLRTPNKDQVFFPDKSKAINEGYYIPCNHDNKHNNKGSIICKLFTIESETFTIETILSINTYGKQFCEINDIDSIMKIEVMVLPIFYMRYMLELELYFIKHFQETKCKRCKGNILHSPNTLHLTNQ